MPRVFPVPPSYWLWALLSSSLPSDAAKRYRVDTEKIGKAVAEAFALKQKQRKAAVAKNTKPEPTVNTAPASA